VSAEHDDDSLELRDGALGSDRVLQQRPPGQVGEQLGLIAEAGPGPRRQDQPGGQENPPAAMKSSFSIRDSLSLGAQIERPLPLKRNARRCT
jgi:hypothetical protein